MQAETLKRMLSHVYAQHTNKRKDLNDQYTNKITGMKPAPQGWTHQGIHENTETSQPWCFLDFCNSKTKTKLSDTWPSACPLYGRAHTELRLTLNKTDLVIMRYWIYTTLKNRLTRLYYTCITTRKENNRLYPIRTNLKKLGFGLIKGKQLRLFKIGKLKPTQLEIWINILPIQICLTPWLRTYVDPRSLPMRCRAAPPRPPEFFPHAAPLD